MNPLGDAGLRPCRDPHYLDFVSGFPCIMCGKEPPSQLHYWYHESLRPWTARRPKMLGDTHATPMCRPCKLIWTPGERKNNKPMAELEIGLHRILEAQWLLMSAWIECTDRVEPFPDENTVDLSSDISHID